MIKVSAVSYLNTRPFIYGLENSAISGELELSLDIPSVCAEKLETGKADIGLAPVAALPKLKGYSVISDYCIGAAGPVRSVMLFSQVPLQELREILLDYQSRTSVLLARVLAEKHWKISPVWKEAKQGYEGNINGSTAGVVIGDRALELQGKFSYAYDLAEEWQKMTSLPFVFACWVGKEELGADFIRSFNTALGKGVDSREEMVAGMQVPETEKTAISAYLREAIDYRLDAKKREAMELFLRYASPQ